MDTDPKGFLHHKMDVKVLILFILARIDTPITGQEIYEVAYQDDSLNYFMFAECLPEMVASGHLTMDDQQRYAITQQGRKQGAEIEDSLATPVVEKVSTAIRKKQLQLEREANITVKAFQDETGGWCVTLSYRDGEMPHMALTFNAPNETLAGVMAQNLHAQADALYKANLAAAIESPKKRSDPQ